MSGLPERSLHRLPTPAPQPATACFHVQAHVEPCVMPRVLEEFAKRGLVPTRWNSVVVGDGLTIDLQMEGLAGNLVEQMANRLRQLVYVQTVLTSEKRYAAA